MGLHGEHTPAGDSDEQMERFKFMLDYSDERWRCVRAIGSGRIDTGGQRSAKGLEGNWWKWLEKRSGGKTGLLGCAGVDMPVGFVEKMK